MKKGCPQAAFFCIHLGLEPVGSAGIQGDASYFLSDWEPDVLIELVD
jgi:hypothetical protein